MFQIVYIFYIISRIENYHNLINLNIIYENSLSLKTRT